MGFFDSSSSSVSTTQTLTHTKPVNVGAQDEGLAIGASESNIHVNILDENAIEKAFNFARSTFEITNDTFHDVLEGASAQVANVTQDFAEKAHAIYTDSTAQIQDAYKTATGKVNLEYILTGVAILTGFLIWKSVKR